MENIAQRFTEECEPYAPMVYRHCLHMLKHREEAEDAAQESMLRAYRAYQRYRGSGVASWLFRIAHNTCLDVLKSARYKREQLGEEVPEMAGSAPTPEDAYLTEADKARLWAAVDALPTDMQTLLTLFYGENMSYQELEAATGLPEGTVKSRLSRAKDALRKGWKKDE